MDSLGGFDCNQREGEASQTPGAVATVTTPCQPREIAGSFGHGYRVEDAEVARWSALWRGKSPPV